MRGFFPKSRKIPLKYRLLIWLICESIEKGGYINTLARVIKYVSLYIKIDRENKTWSITSEPMHDPSWKKIDYSDIEAIFKAKPSAYKVVEIKKADGTFGSFTVSTW